MWSPVRTPLSWPPVATSGHQWSPVVASWSPVVGRRSVASQSPVVARSPGRSWTGDQLSMGHSRVAVNQWSVWKYNRYSRYSRYNRYNRDTADIQQRCSRYNRDTVIPLPAPPYGKYSARYSTNTAQIQHDTADTGVSPGLCPNYETAKQQSWGLDRLSVKRE
jgi:hypothetical protein